MLPQCTVQYMSLLLDHYELHVCMVEKLCPNVHTYSGNYYCLWLIITGDASEVFSEEVLESQKKYFVPQLTSSKSGNHDHLDKEQSSMVWH